MAITQEVFDAMLRLMASNSEMKKMSEETSRIAEYIVTDGVINRRIAEILEKDLRGKNRHQEKQEFALNRLQRTCVRLEEKGILVNTLQELLLKLSMEFPDHSALFLPEEEWDTKDIPEVDWYMAIEAVMIRRAPELIPDLSCKNFTPIISKHKEELWTYVACFSNIRSQELRRKVTIVESSHREKQRKMMETVEQENERLRHEVSLLKGRLEKSIEKNQELNATIEGIHAETEKKILGIRAEIRKTVESLEQQVLTLQKENDVLRGTHTADAASVPDENESEKGEKELHDLPEERVLFLGGHENMIKKLRQKHPGWTYIGNDSISKITWDMTFDVCFVWYKHLTHTVSQIVQNRLNREGPVLYLNATNLDYLEQEMMIGYANLVNRKIESDSQ